MYRHAIPKNNRQKLLIVEPRIACGNPSKGRRFNRELARSFAAYSYARHAGARCTVRCDSINN
jgi:hypothetical protein